jgi:hypothetical protein
MPGTEKGYLENRVTEKPRLSSYMFPRAAGICRRLLPVFPNLAFRETFPSWEHLFTEHPLWVSTPEVLCTLRMLRFCVVTITVVSPLKN